MSERWRKYSPEFRQEALKRMQNCTSVAGLARELGIRRKWLYQWKQDAAKAHPEGVGGDERGPERRTVQRLEEKVKRLESLVARQGLELDFFKGALQRVEERRRKRGATSGPASTSKSGKQTGCKAN